MGTRSQDPYPRGTLVRDRDGDTWRKGTAWWHWTKRSAETGPGKLLWDSLVSMYGPLTVTYEPSRRTPRDHARRLAQ